MDRNDFGGAVIPAMAGFFLFGKRAKVQEIQEEKPKQLPVLAKNETDGVTGVTRYLLSAPVISGVAKYIKKSEKHSTTGVAKYVLRQTIAERSAPVPSSVSKYLLKVAKEPQTPKKTGVEKYLAKQEKERQSAIPSTGVARYQAAQDLVAKKKAAAELIQKFRETEEASAIAAKEAAAAAYEASRDFSKEEGNNLEVETSQTTRVGRYLKEQDAVHNNKKATGVAKYLARQIIIDSQKPTLSKVAKYLQSQSLTEKSKPKLTGVSKYLSKQQTTEKTKVYKESAKVSSSVSRYLAAQEELESLKPKQSSVSKYLERQAKLIAMMPEKRLEAPKAVSQECLEGEFIPASEFVANRATGVSRYIENQGEVVSVAKEVAKERITGVSRYIDRQVESVKKSLLTTPLTGVDRYLLNKAS